MKYAELYKKYMVNQDKLNYCYLGIKRSDFPRWQGWKIIEYYKAQGIKVNKIQDPVLDLLVENFYLFLFLKESQNERSTS